MEQQTELEQVECEACRGSGYWESECCNGAGGCSCRGEVVDMGPCNVCHGTGIRGPNDDLGANIKAIGSRCYLGSGPRR
jgi:hypothetical protein